MTRIRVRRVLTAGTLLALGWGAFSTARAQASGTLQATATVIDEPVSRIVSAELRRAILAAGERGRTTSIPQTTLVDVPAAGARATLREAAVAGAERLLRVDIVYLD